MDMEEMDPAMLAQLLGSGPPSGPPQGAGEMDAVIQQMMAQAASMGIPPEQAMAMIMHQLSGGQPGPMAGGMPPGPMM